MASRAGLGLLSSLNTVQNQGYRGGLQSLLPHAPRCSSSPLSSYIIPEPGAGLRLTISIMLWLFLAFLGFFFPPLFFFFPRF